MTTTTQITTVTVLPITAVTSLLAQSKMQSGAINAPDASGNILVEGKANLTVPVADIGNFVDAPTGYSSVVFAGGHFNVDDTGENVVLTATWNVTK